MHGHGYRLFLIDMEGADRYSRWFETSVICLVMGALFYGLSQTVADPDLWGHIKFGQDLWQTGALVRNDTYSYLTADQLWLNHEWLSEAIFYLVFARTGSRGLILLKLAVSLLIAALLYRCLRRQGLNPLRAGIVLLALSPLMSPWLSSVRPQMFTFLLFLLVLLAIRNAEEGRLWGLWALAPLFALWANLHGGFLAGLGILLLWAFVHLVTVLSRSGSSLSFASGVFIPLAVVASLAATLLNPYGVELWTFLLRTATAPRPTITEWRPLVVMSRGGAIYLTILGFAAAALWHSRRDRSPALLVLFVCASLLPLTAVRHAPLFALAVAVLTGEHLSDVWNRLTSERSTVEPPAWLTGLSFVFAMVLVGLSLPHFRCVSFDAPSGFRYPVAAVTLLERSGVSGNLAISFSWGEYALWHLSPRIKVSMDGRRETVYSDEIYRMYFDFSRGRGNWDALLREHGTELALVSKEFPVMNLLRSNPDWISVYEDSVSGLFVQRGSPLVDALRGAGPLPPAEDSEGRCFP